MEQMKEFFKDPEQTKEMQVSVESGENKSKRKGLVSM